jgi:hypothetical protein
MDPGDVGAHFAEVFEVVGDPQPVHFAALIRLVHSVVVAPGDEGLVGRGEDEAFVIGADTNESHPRGGASDHKRNDCRHNHDQTPMSKLVIQSRIVLWLVRQCRFDQRTPRGASPGTSLDLGCREDRPGLGIRQGLGRRSASAYGPWVDAVGCEISSATTGGSDGQLEDVFGRAGMLTEDGGCNLRVKSSGAQLFEDNSRAPGEIAFEEPLLFSQPLLVAGIWWVTPVTAPARRFRNDGLIHFRRTFHPTCRRRGRSQSPVIEEVLLDAVGKSQAKLGVLSKSLGQMHGRLNRRIHCVVTQPLQDLFAVPNKVLKRAGRSTAADGVPILVFAPVLVTGVVVEQQVIDELSEVELLLEPFVG